MRNIIFNKKTLLLLLYEKHENNKFEKFIQKIYKKIKKLIFDYPILIQKLKLPQRIS